MTKSECPVCKREDVLYPSTVSPESEAVCFSCLDADMQVLVQRMKLAMSRKSKPVPKLRVSKVNAKQVAHEMCMKHTGKPLSHWEGRSSDKLMMDVSSGKFNPKKWIPFYYCAEFFHRYTEIEFDDVEICMIDVNIIKKQNPRWKVPGQFVKQADMISGKPVEVYLEALKAPAMRLDPDKFGVLYDMYQPRQENRHV